jgi:hypothetical protein
VDDPPRELVVDAKAAPGDSSDGGGSAMAPFALPVIAGGLLAKYVSPTVGLLGLGAAIVVLIALRKPRQGRFILRIGPAGLEVTRERPTHAAPPSPIPLLDLMDVTLERKTHQSGRAAATERMRLALERRAPAEPIYLPDERITPIEAQEWQGKVRVFLRKHGWVPADER